MQIDSQRLIEWLNCKIEELEKEYQKNVNEYTVNVGADKYKHQIEFCKEFIEYIKFCDIIGVDDHGWKKYVGDYPNTKPPEYPPFTYTSDHTDKYKTQFDTKSISDNTQFKSRK